MIRSQTAERIARIELARPDKKNALTAEMYAQLTAALDAAGKDPQVRVVLLRGSADCSTTPALRYPCCHMVSNTSSVTCVNGEFSMSMRTKNSCFAAASRIRRRLSTQVARSMVRPSWVSFSEMFRPTPAATMVSSIER